MRIKTTFAEFFFDWQRIEDNEEVNYKFTDFRGENERIENIKSG